MKLRKVMMFVSILVVSMFCVSNVAFASSSPKKILKLMSDATENYAALDHQYPLSFEILTFTYPAFAPENYCGQFIGDWTYVCTNTAYWYEYQAVNIFTQKTLTISTGGVFEPAGASVNIEAFGRKNIRLLAMASEVHKEFFGTYATDPDQLNNLIGNNVGDFCGMTEDNFRIACELTEDSYRFIAKPTSPLLTGNTQYVAETGFIITP